MNLIRCYLDNGVICWQESDSHPETTFYGLEIGEHHVVDKDDAVKRFNEAYSRALGDLGSFRKGRRFVRLKI